MTEGGLAGKPGWIAAAPRLRDLSGVDGHVRWAPRVIQTFGGRLHKRRETAWSLRLLLSSQWWSMCCCSLAILLQPSLCLRDVRLAPEWVVKTRWSNYVCDSTYPRFVRSLTTGFRSVVRCVPSRMRSRLSGVLLVELMRCVDAYPAIEIVYLKRRHVPNARGCCGGAGSSAVVSCWHIAR